MRFGHQLEVIEVGNGYAVVLRGTQKLVEDGFATRAAANAAASRYRRYGL